MNLRFVRGTANDARGHALAYFRASDGTILATYLVVPPIVIDLAKYMPPMFAGQIPSMGRTEATAMPMPPVPEVVEGGIPTLERLADARGDDLLDGGSVPSDSVERLLLAAAEVGRAYGDVYRQRQFDAAPTAAPEDAELAVDEVLASLMGDHERIGEIAKLVGRLRYAIEGHDGGLAKETVADMTRLARHLPPKYRAGEIIAAAQVPGDSGARLTELHVDRCLKLAREDYAAVARIEAEIRALAPPTS